MNDIRRTILWVIFGFSMVLLWDQWQVHNGHKATFFPAQNRGAVSSSESRGNTATVLPGALIDPPPATVSFAAAPQSVSLTAKNSSETVAPQLPRQRVELSTDVLKLVFDSEGGSLVRAELLKHVDMQDQSKNLVLLDQSKDRIYAAQSGLVAGAGGGSFATHTTRMSVQDGPRVMVNGTDSLQLRFESPALSGVRLVKTYTLHRGSYVLDVKHEVVNQSDQPVAPQLYWQLVRDGNKPPGESSFYSTFTGPAVYTSEKKYQKVEFSDIKKGKVDIVTSTSDGYIAMVQHYFASAWLLPDGVKRSLSMTAVDLGQPLADCCYRVTMLSPLDAIAPGATKTVESRLFVGPQEEKALETLTPGLELVKDYGLFTIVAKPLYWLLDQLHSLIGNWGWSIVALVVVIKIAFYWLNAKAFASMAKTKAITPRITEMRERLKDKPQEMQQEMMRIYREEKINPMGGCLPIMVQIPVFIALYWVLLSSVEMRNAPWALWIHDLATPDPYFILPIVMTGTSLLQTWLNPAPPDPMQAKMMWFMPLAFGVMFFFFPAGLVLYYIVNNGLTILQQWFINKRMGVLGK